MTESAIRRGLPLALLFVALATRPAAALVIDVDYGASVTGSAYGTQLEAAFGQVAAAYEGMFTNPITVTIDVEAMTSGLGQSVTSVLGPVSYSSWYNALASDSANALASQAAASLSPTQQAVGTGIRLTTANARALGLYPATGLVAGAAPDSTLSFNAAVLDYTGTGQPGLYDVFASPPTSSMRRSASTPPCPASPTTARCPSLPSPRTSFATPHRASTASAPTRPSRSGSPATAAPPIWHSSTRSTASATATTGRSAAA